MLSLWQYSRQYVPNDMAITCLIRWTQKSLKTLIGINIIISDLQPNWRDLFPGSWKDVFKSELPIFIELYNQTDSLLTKLRVNDKVQEVVNIWEDGIQIQNYLEILVWS